MTLQEQRDRLLKMCIEAEEWLDNHGGYGVGDDDPGLVELLEELRQVIAEAEATE
jgi:hypothetical protein